MNLYLQRRPWQRLPQAQVDILGDSLSYVPDRLLRLNSPRHCQSAGNLQVAGRQRLATANVELTVSNLLK